jgi:hypothetical protein
MVGLVKFQGKYLVQCCFLTGVHVFLPGGPGQRILQGRLHRFGFVAPAEGIYAPKIDLLALQVLDYRETIIELFLMIEQECYAITPVAGVPILPVS